LLASQADTVSLDPMGMVMVEGLSVYSNYFHEALDKLGVNVHVFRVGEYKSAVEPFLRDDMSAEAREANKDWLDDLWADTPIWSLAHASCRDAVQSYVKGLRDGLAGNGGDAAAYAEQSKLVTWSRRWGEFRTRIGQTVGMDDDIAVSGRSTSATIWRPRITRAAARSATPKARSDW